MKKLSMCRICLVENVRMQLIVSSHLQETYESLTSMPFDTEDNRPLLACYICCAKLKNCYQLRKLCLQSEELFTQILNSNVPVPSELREISQTHRLEVTAVTHLSLGYVDSEVTLEAGQSVTYDVEVKVEEVEDFGNEPFEKDAVEEDAHSSFVEDDLFLPAVEEEQSDVPTSTYIPPAMPTNSEDLRPYNLRPKIRKSKDDLKNINKMAVKDKTDDQTNDELPESQDEVQEKVNKFTSAVKDIDKGKSVSSGDQDIHIRTHTGEKPYQCYVCEKYFDVQSDLIDHALAHAYEPHQCNICEESFSSKWQLNMHVRTHIAKGPHQCDFCGKCFSVKYNLIDHIRLHTGEKPYQCNVCKKSFNTNSALRYHNIRTHTDGKPHQCDVCMKHFSTKYKLKYHIRTHTGEKNLKRNV